MFKKFLISLIVLFFAAGAAYADWSVTVNWVASPGPDLAYEKVFLDGTNEKCNIAAGQTTTCTFVVTALTNQEVSIISYNSQDTASQPYIVGNLLNAPAPASGGVITITIVP